jgi:hypothetical protein
MAFYPDLSPYCYHHSGNRPNTQNVGWIDAAHSFSKGTASGAFLKGVWQFCKNPAIQMLGFHNCELCNTFENDLRTKVEFEGESLSLGSREIRVITPNGTIYAAPDLVFHYVRDHQYRPPQEFIDAVLSPETDPGTPQYRNEIKKLLNSTKPL